MYLRMELINLQSNIELKHFFEKKGKFECYGKYIYEDKFPFLKQLAMRITAAMGTRYLYESLFSKLKIVKSKNRHNLSKEI